MARVITSKIVVNAVRLSKAQKKMPVCGKKCRPASAKRGTSVDDRWIRSGRDRREAASSDARTARKRCPTQEARRARFEQWELFESGRHLEVSAARRNGPARVRSNRGGPHGREFVP